VACHVMSCCHPAATTLRGFRTLAALPPPTRCYEAAPTHPCRWGGKTHTDSPHCPAPSVATSRFASNELPEGWTSFRRIENWPMAHCLWPERARCAAGIHGRADRPAGRLPNPRVGSALASASVPVMKRTAQIAWRARMCCLSGSRPKPPVDGWPTRRLFGTPVRRWPPGILGVWGRPPYRNVLHCTAL
jgi:hypothetical protein